MFKLAEHSRSPITLPALTRSSLVTEDGSLFVQSLGLLGKADRSGQHFNMQRRRLLFHSTDVRFPLNVQLPNYIPLRPVRSTKCRCSPCEGSQSHQYQALLV
ncbi:hypothetical protein PAXRUDRAFT_555476 [Paxillus rubicundulus Ve08.2h10]|uniref:Uncharacterized protein n=1 Tax=Paxillus rubicundulus Ve08.2h10 TaxID=930991 RepID=A0A0D0D794_9AGAM|nr:hypothetical protein PAXRUDRAFT_555476 [Paxillus rubicundulus Ve08.2h10]